MIFLCAEAVYCALDAASENAPKRRSLRLNSSNAASNIGLVKAGPHAIGKDEFRIGRLPEQNVRKALFTAGANQQSTSPLSAVNDCVSICAIPLVKYCLQNEVAYGRFLA